MTQIECNLLLIGVASSPEAKCWWSNKAFKVSENQGNQTQVYNQLFHI